MHPHLYIYLVICLVIGLLGSKRKLGFWGYFFGSMALTPLMGVFLVLASGPKQSN